MPFFVGDRVTCNAAKVLGNQHAKQRSPKATEEEIFVLYSLTRTSEARRDFWSTKNGLFLALRFGERPQATSGPQFDVLLMVLMNREYRKYFRGDSTVLMNLYLRGEGKGMPHVTCIERKPKGVGCELKKCADADTKIILQLEIQEGAAIMAAKEYVAEYNPGIPLLMGPFPAPKKRPSHWLLSNAIFNFIPKVYTSVRHVEALICNEHQRLLDIDKEEAKYKYIQLCYSLPTFGITFFLVQERRKKMDTLRLLGVGRNNVVRLDVKRKNIISTWPLSTIRRWTYCTDTFSLDFGQYSTNVYTAKTTEGEIISDFLSSYVNIVLGSHHKLSDLVTDTIPVTDDHFYEMVTPPGENKIAMQDCPAYDIGKRT
eukprot:Em0010g94a